MTLRTVLLVGGPADGTLVRVDSRLEHYRHPVLPPLSCVRLHPEIEPAPSVPITIVEYRIREVLQEGRIYDIGTLGHDYRPVLTILLESYVRNASK
jgi:hypothetical protein